MRREGRAVLQEQDILLGREKNLPANCPVVVPEHRDRLPVLTIDPETGSPQLQCVLSLWPQTHLHVFGSF